MHSTAVSPFLVRETLLKKSRGEFKIHKEITFKKRNYSFFMFRDGPQSIVGDVVKLVVQELPVLQHCCALRSL